MVVIKYLKSSGDDLLLQTSFPDIGDHIFWNQKRRECGNLGLTKSEGIRKRFDYIPNRIESAKILKTGTKSGTPQPGLDNGLNFFILGEKMEGSAALKQGPSANRKHTYFFFLPNQHVTCIIRASTQENLVLSIANQPAIIIRIPTHFCRLLITRQIRRIYIPRRRVIWEKHVKHKTKITFI